MDHNVPNRETGWELRQRIRRGEWPHQTSGMAPGYVQANLAILPREYAADFQRFCALNPKPCPLLASSEPGDPALPSLGRDIDIRTDIGKYRIWRDGVMVEEVEDISAHWRDDLVCFLLGCSHSFEEALIADGLPVKHIDQGKAVPVYYTDVPTTPSGVFHGPLVVSMRAFKPADAIRAIQITSRFPNVHGAPVHIGKPEMIGVDLNRIDAGDFVETAEDELPLFWACGVTPQSVVAASKPSFCITHAPGHMLVTDLLNSRLGVF